MSTKTIYRSVGVIAAICTFAAVGVAEAANIIKGVFVNAETGEYLVSPVYVSKSGNDANSGADWEHAKLTIQAGINAASAGGVVLVGPGDYSDTSSYTDDSTSIQTVAIVNKKVYLKSSEGKDATFITGAWGSSSNGTGSGAKRGVRITVAGAVVDGFTIRNCAVPTTTSGNRKDNCGAGVCGDGGQETAYNATLGKNVATGATTSPSYVVNCTIENCRAFHGAAIREVVPINCLFKGNIAASSTEATKSHVGYRLYSAYNCIFIGNGTFGSSSGKVIEAAASHMAVNCTFLFNNCDSFTGPSATEPGRAYNCAFLANAGESAPTANFTSTNNISRGSFQLKTNGVGCNDRASLYQYFSPAEWDFTPVVGSESLDGGSDEALASVAWIPDDFREVDFNGNPRKVGAAVDVGAVEAPEGGAVITASPIGIGAGVTLTMDGVSRSTPEIPNTWYAITNTKPSMARATCTLAEGKELFAYDLSYFNLTTALNSWTGYRYPDKLGDGGAWFMPGKLSEGGFVVGVKVATDVKIVGAGETYETINAAISAGSDFDVIKVKPGTYTGSSEGYVVSVEGHRAIRAIGTPEETIIKGGTNLRCVWVNPKYPALRVHVQGFTLTGAHVNYEGGAAFIAATNSVSTTSGSIGFVKGDSINAQITDCIISNNYAKFASAVYGGWAQRCFIANNTSVSSNDGRNVAVYRAVASSCLLVDNFTDNTTCRQISESAAYNCTISDSTTNHRLFDMLGLYNCYGVGGQLPWPDSTYATAYGCVSIDSTKNGSGVANVEPFSNVNNHLADRAGGDYRPLGNSWTLRFGSTTPWYFTRFAVGDMNSMPIIFWNNSTPVPGAYQVPVPVVNVASTRSTEIDPMTVSPSTGRKEPGDTITITRASHIRPVFGYVVRGVTNLTTETTWIYTVPDEGYAGETEIRPITIPLDLYVDPSKSDGNSGFTADLAKKTLAGVMSIASDGDVVHAAAGEYAEGEMTNTVTFLSSARGEIGCRVNVPAGVTLRAEGGRDETVIKGRYHSASSRWGVNALRAVFLEPGAVIDGFTIRDGATRGGDGYGGVYDDNHGGCVASTIIGNARGPGFVRNCTIFGGGARTAGGVCGGIVDHCYIYGCTVTSDSGGSAYSRIENSVIYNESQTTVNFHFGVINSTIRGASTCSDNEMRSCDWYHENYPVANSIVLVPGYVYQKVFTYTNWSNCVVLPTSNNSRMEFDENACTNIIRATVAELGLNPAAGGFLPAVDSVAIDAGDNTLLAQLRYNDGTDYAGTQRIYNRTVDIGALEYDWRETYAQTLAKSRRFAVASADPEVAKTGNAVEVFDGALDVTCRAAGNTVNLGIDVLGNGTLTLFMGEDAVATFTSESAKTYTLNGTAADGLTNLRFEYAKADGDERGALLSGFECMSGMMLIFR